MIDRQKLLHIVSEFRDKIESVWSEQSAYRVPEIEEYGAHIPGGQCAVTCMMLMCILKKEFPSESVLFVGGSLHSDPNKTIIIEHVWLKIEEGQNSILIDPTIDQASGINEKVLVATMNDLKKLDLRYIEKEIESDHGENEHPNRFNRYQILKNTWNERYPESKLN